MISLISAVGIARANGPEVGINAGSIFPIASEDIQLVSETVCVQIPMDWDDVTVHCDYTLRNLTDQDKTFKVGFVTSATVLLSKRFEEKSDHRLPFNVRQDDKSLPVTIQLVDHLLWDDFLGGEQDSLPVWEMTIPAREKAQLSIHYASSWSGGGEGKSYGMIFTYYARSASLWAGSIEKANITFCFGGILTKLLRFSQPDAPGLRISIEPEGYTWYSNGLKWEFTNWEPATDFVVSIDITEGDDE